MIVLSLGNGESPNEAQFRVFLLLMSDALLICAAILAIALIHALTTRQEVTNRAFSHEIQGPSGGI